MGYGKTAVFAKKRLTIIMVFVIESSQKGKILTTKWYCEILGMQ
jgi:hypothetical protein